MHSIAFGLHAGVTLSAQSNGWGRRRCLQEIALPSESRQIVCRDQLRVRLPLRSAHVLTVSIMKDAQRLMDTLKPMAKFGPRRLQTGARVTSCNNLLSHGMRGNVKHVQFGILSTHFPFTLPLSILGRFLSFSLSCSSVFSLPLSLSVLSLSLFPLPLSHVPLPLFHPWTRMRATRGHVGFVSDLSKVGSHCHKDYKGSVTLLLSLSLHLSFLLLRSPSCIEA